MNPLSETTPAISNALCQALTARVPSTVGSSSFTGCQVLGKVVQFLSLEELSHIPASRSKHIRYRPRDSNDLRPLADRDHVPRDDEHDERHHRDDLEQPVCDAMRISEFNVGDRTTEESRGTYPTENSRLPPGECFPKQRPGNRVSGERPNRGNEICGSESCSI